MKRQSCSERLIEFWRGEGRILMRSACIQRNNVECRHTPPLSFRRNRDVAKAEEYSQLRNSPYTVQYKEYWWWGQVSKTRLVGIRKFNCHQALSWLKYSNIPMIQPPCRPSRNLKLAVMKSVLTHNCSVPNGSPVRMSWFVWSYHTFPRASRARELLFGCAGDAARNTESD